MFEEYLGNFLGAFIVTFLLTRLTNKLFGIILKPIKTVLLSFFLVSISLVVLSSHTMGIRIGLITYIPCLVIIVIYDIYKKTSKNNHLIPKKNQWKNWSLPSRLTAIGTLAGIISLSTYFIEKIYLTRKYFTYEESEKIRIEKTGAIITGSTNIHKCKGEYLFRWNTPPFVGKKSDYFDEVLKHEIDIFEILTVDGLGLIINKNIKLLAIGSEALNAYGGSNGNYIEKTIGFPGGNWRIIIEDIKGSYKNPISPFKIGNKYQPHKPVSTKSFNPSNIVPSCPNTASGIG